MIAITPLPHRSTVVIVVDAVPVAARSSAGRQLRSDIAQINHPPHIGHSIPPAQRVHVPADLLGGDAGGAAGVREGRSQDADAALLPRVRGAAALTLRLAQRSPVGRTVSQQSCSPPGMPAAPPKAGQGSQRAKHGFAPTPHPHTPGASSRQGSAAETGTQSQWVTSATDDGPAACLLLCDLCGLCGNNFPCGRHKCRPYPAGVARHRAGVCPVVSITDRRQRVHTGVSVTQRSGRRVRNPPLPGMRTGRPRSGKITSGTLEPPQVADGDARPTW